MSLTGIAFLLCFATGIWLAFFRHAKYGLYLYMAIYYLDPHSRWWGQFMPNMRWSLLAGLILLLATLRLPSRPDVVPWFRTTPAKLLIAFTLWMWLQNLWALAPDEHLEGTILFTKYVVLFAIFYRLMETPADVRDCLVVHVAGCAYLGWLGYIAPPGGRLEGVGGPGIDDANALAMFMGTGIICGAMVILAERGWRQWLAMLSMPFILNTIVQSQSRGAMLAIVCAGLILFYMKPRPYRIHFYAFALLGVVLFGIVAQDSFWNRMRTLTATVDQNVELDSSAESRIVVVKAQFRMAWDYPLGVGHRGTAVLSPRYLDAKWLAKSPDDPDGIGARSSHNSYMSALVEQGIPGAIVFLGFPVWVLRSVGVFKRHQKVAANAKSHLLIYAPATIGALVVVFVAGMFTDYIKTEVQIWMFALLAALSRVLLPREQVVEEAAPKAGRHGSNKRRETRTPGSVAP
ncbi:MAG: O-antigen ligase family protein [Steroidobacteraceae bacterium]